MKDIKMNYWTKQSVEFANQKNYLDELFRVYPTIPNGIRDINEAKWAKVEEAFEGKNNIELLNHVLDLELFPIKDSYVAYLKRDKDAKKRNPETVNRLAGRLYEMGLDKLYEKCSEPKETNRQLGPLFKRWINKGVIGAPILNIEEFSATKDNAILNASDAEMMNWAKLNLNYNRNKGLDFVARFNGKYVVGEAKFLTDFGGHQSAQFEDAIATLKYPNVNAIQIAILDGVLYIPTKNKMYQSLENEYSNENIMSSLVLREFLYSI
ncbi:MAG: hypothetical protein R3Y46_01220 [Opitutales bacterium]